MSDDIPFLFADEIARPKAPGRRVVFLSAMSATQMHQYAAGGWTVIAGPGFQPATEIDLAAVPAQSGTEDHLTGADLISLEAPTWGGDAANHFKRWAPRAIKLNGAFHNLDPARSEAMAAELAKLGYDLIGCHWRDDNTYRQRSLTRIDRLAAFGAPDWKHMNVVALREPEFARVLLAVARLYAGEERRIAELKLGHAVRGDHIARLEDAMTALQKRIAH